MWLGGRDTRLLPSDTPAEIALTPGPCAIVLRNIDATDLSEDQGRACRAVGDVQGLAIGAGREVRLQVLDCSGAP